MGHSSSSENDENRFKPNYDIWFDENGQKSRLFALCTKKLIQISTPTGDDTLQNTLNRYY